MPPVRTVPSGSTSSASNKSSGLPSSAGAAVRNPAIPTAPPAPPPTSVPTSAEPMSEGTSLPVPGELKPQKACVSCRRSKVKCIHDGAPPCRRCAESNTECKFRLRADDERWRERTDETLSKLSLAVDTLISRGAAGGGRGRGTSVCDAPVLHAHPLRSASFTANSAYGPEPTSSSHFPPFAASRSSSFHDRHHSISGASPPGIPPLVSPTGVLAHPQGGGGGGPSTPSDRSGPLGNTHHSIPTSTSSSTPYPLGRSPGPYAFGPLHALRDGEDARMVDAGPLQPNGMDTTHSRSSGGGGPHGRLSSASSSLSSMLPPPLPSTQPNSMVHAGLPSGTGPHYVGGGGGGHRISAASPLPMPPALIPGLDTLSASGPVATAGPASSATSATTGTGTAWSQQQVAVPAPVPIAPDQTLPSSLLLQVGAEAASVMASLAGATTSMSRNGSSFGISFDGGSGGGGGGGGGRASSMGMRGAISGMGGGGGPEGGRVRWHVGAPSPYASPAVHLGRDDPRLNAMSLGLIPMEKARALFVFFAEHLQPHCFGFPTYAASEQMTPLIISCILTVGSLLDPTGQTGAYYPAVRDDALNLIKVDEVIDGPDMPLNPELGIGVEEITGAAIASAWLGGEVAFKIARTVRWWAVGYLRHFELPSRNLTLGEYMTILPPFRQIDLCDKLRIWLTAYVAESQQCFLFDRPSLASASASADNQHQQHPSPQAYCQELRAAFRGTEPAFAVPAADRQLIAHAGVLAILIEAQTVQRERRWERDAKAQLAGQLQSQQQHYHNNNSSSQGQRSNGGGGHHGSDAGGTPGSGGGGGGSQGTVTTPQPPTVAQEVAQGLRNLVAFGQDWIEDVERWMVAARKLEDLSGCSGISLDITMMYHLSRAWLGSSALEATRVLHSLTSTHGDKARAVTQGLDSLFDVVEHQVIRAARDGAVRALQLASNRTEGFGDRLAYLPSLYHFLLSHATSFLLLLIQRHRRWRYLLSGETAELLRVAEEFVQVYTYAIEVHGVSHEQHAGVRHPSRATCKALLRALQQAKASI
ncbi:unnamed protein product [Tilletia controversa]|nr:unnamed protein product [Tilletia controversa]